MEFSLRNLGRGVISAVIPDKARTRDSNMELLRIVAMSMILCGHFLVHSFSRAVPRSMFCMLEPIFIYGVNLFFLISGWFGIRFSVRSFVRLAVITAFFSMVSVGLLALCGVDVVWWEIRNRFIWPISWSRYWFIMVYAMLMVLAPILNGGLRAMSRRQVGMIVILLTIYNIYGGFFGGNYTNVNGFTIAQAVWLYITAHWLRLHSDSIAHVSRYWYLGLYIIVTGMQVLLPVLFKADVHWLVYNNPFVVAGAVALFLYFTQLRFRSYAVNSIAPAAFGCYMLQDGLFGHEYLYWTVYNAYSGVFKESGAVAGLLDALPMCLAIVAAIWCASLVLTPIAEWLARWVCATGEMIARRGKSLMGRLTSFS